LRKQLIGKGGAERVQRRKRPTVDNIDHHERVNGRVEAVFDVRKLHYLAQFGFFGSFRFGVRGSCHAVEFRHGGGGGGGGLNVTWGAREGAGEEAREFGEVEDCGLALDG